MTRRFTKQHLCREDIRSKAFVQSCQHKHRNLKNAPAFLKRKTSSQNKKQKSRHKTVVIHPEGNMNIRYIQSI